MGYNVALVGTRAAESMEGIVTQTRFDSKEKFDEWYTEKIKALSRVVEEGISPERGVELVRLTPLACRKAHALFKATNPNTGEVDEETLGFELEAVERTDARNR